jgi:2-dehydro-3-deoxygalactonokinase
MTQEATALIGIDWGTSRQRAYRIDHQGRVLERRSGDLGLSAVRGKDFDAALRTLISDWLASAGDIPVLMSGMVGSRNGWVEAAYCECPFGIEELSRTLVPVKSPGASVFIAGGGHATDARGHHDVMRGEETQFLGLENCVGRQLALAPGTHSKWALLEDGLIRSFRTYMTGEMFALLKDHSILGWLMPDGQAGADDDMAFAEGVKDAETDADLLHSLFDVRTSGLFEPERAAGLSSYLSGILIGSEITGAVKAYPAGAITIIAAPGLARRYNLALVNLGLTDVRLEDVDAVTARGLWRIWQARKEAP